MLTLLLVLSLLRSVPGAGAADAVRVDRLGGPTRFDTAVRISQATFEGRGDAWLARGDVFADALVASYPAGYYNDGGPILLSQHDELLGVVRQELERLGTHRVFIMGSVASISEKVQAQIEELGVETVRVGGADRFQTSSSAAGIAPDGDYGTAFVVTGMDFADALVAGPLAYRLLRPIILTTPERLHPEAARTLRERGILEVVIVGGPSAVSEQVRREIEDICYRPDECITTRRVGGRDRTETAALLADELVASTGEPQHVNLARGDLFPDAAAGGPHGGQEAAPILLTHAPDSLGDASRAWLERHASTISSLHIFGTEDAVSSRVAEEAREAATARDAG